MLTPEHSIQIQNAIGADIIMQLDDVVKTTITGPRVEEAMHRYNYCFNNDFFCNLYFYIKALGFSPRSKCTLKILQNT